MSDNSGNALVRAFEKLRDSVYAVPYSPNTNDQHINGLRADVDALKEAIETHDGLPVMEQRSNGSVDKDEPIEHTDAYKNRDNDWLGFAEGGQLTRTVNEDKLDEQKSRERKEEQENERQDRLAQGQDRDGVSNSADQRKTNR